MVDDRKHRRGKSKDIEETRDPWKDIVMGKELVDMKKQKHLRNIKIVNDLKIVDMGIA